MGEREIQGRKRGGYRGEREGETGEKEREREIEREREREGRKKKITNTKKFMEFYLVVLHSAEQSEARQVSCYNPLSCFNPVTIKYKPFKVCIDILQLLS